MPKNITIAVTNDGGLADPAALIYAVSPPPLHDGDTVKSWPDSSPTANDALRAGRLTDDCPQGDTLVGMQDVQWWQFSQSFTAKGGRLHSAKFNLGAHAGATGNVFARLYAVTGVVGSTAFPTGPPLVSSEPVSAALCQGWVEFNFTGANAIDMVVGTDYCIAVDGQLVTGAPIGIYYWAAGTHAGNMGGQLYGGNPWGVFGGAGADLPFQLYVESDLIFRENVLGGYPVVRLAQISSFDLTTPIPNAHPWTLVVVMKNASALTLQALGWSAGGAAFLERNDGYETVMSPTNSIYISPSAGLQSAFHVFVIQTDLTNGTALVWCDGVQQAQVQWQGPFTNPFTQLCLGDGDFVEQLLCAATLSTTERQNAEMTLATKYGTPAPPAGSVISLATLPQLKGWWRANSLGDNFIKQWVDRSRGNVAKPIGEPLLVKNALNGHPVVRLRSATHDGFNLVTPIPNTAPYTSFVVMKSAGANGPMSLVSATQHGTGSYWGGIWYGGCSWYSLGLGVGAESVNWHCFTNSQVDGALANIYMDGVRGNNSGAGGDTNPFITIGYMGGSFGDGDLALILMCDGLLADTDRQNAEKTISAKYGTPAPPAGSVIDLATLPNIRCWWEADTLL
jgi:hypothetical protein